MPFRFLSNEQTQSIARHRIETLELWLRRLVHDELTAEFGEDYFSATESGGQNVINGEIRRAVRDRLVQEPDRFPRNVDALILDHLVDIVCKASLYERHFKAPLREAFPEGCTEARTFLKRLIPIRNRLAHANSITAHQAEQAVCYADDVLASIKQYYVLRNMAQEYNVPRLLTFTDSLGHRREISSSRESFGFTPAPPLRPGDTISFEVEADASFDPAEYKIEWRVDATRTANGPHFALELKNEHVADMLLIAAQIVSSKKWHKHSGYDGRVEVWYQVLPPIEES
ncbi:hypothetical protein [Caballeronia sp. LjRoot31]|uniref:hypothetical protein n=1 Tax=Caballeronia sp. LjRoot31 TaxID=3342324 RepID=UPI003ECF3A14